MKILLVKKIGTDIHGTVTLALRLFNYFNENGHECYLTQYNNSPLLQELKWKSYLLKVNEWWVPFHAKRYQAVEFDVIYCLTTDDAVTGLQLQYRYFRKAKLFIGVYHPKQFFVPTFFFPNYREYLNRKIVKRIPPANLVFMDEPCKVSHSKYYSMFFDESPVIPLPMEIYGKVLAPVNDTNKIVSVGRLNNFKPYPFGVIKAVHFLKNNGYPKLTYHVVGDGNNLEKLTSLVKKLGLKDNVIFYGNVPYAEINEIIKDAFCFIGMGTTVGEAAGIGLPSLVAIIDEEDKTYGLIGSLPENILGEPGEQLPLYNYQDALTNILQLSDGEYKAEQARSIEKASFFSVNRVGKKFIEMFNGGQVFSMKISLMANMIYLFTKVQVRFLVKKEYRHK